MVGYIILLSMWPKQCVLIENNQSNLVIANNNSLWHLLNIPKQSRRERRGRERPIIHVSILSSYEDMRKTDFLQFSGGHLGLSLIAQIAQRYRGGTRQFLNIYGLNINKKALDPKKRLSTNMVFVCWTIFALLIQEISYYL